MKIKVIDLGGASQDFTEIVAFTPGFLNESKYFEKYPFSHVSERIMCELYTVYKTLDQIIKHDFDDLDIREFLA